MPKEPKDTKPATRTSRRLRSSQEPDASPLKEYVPPKRKTRGTSTKADESSRKPVLYTPPVEITTTTAVDEENKKDSEEQIKQIITPNQIITPYNVYDIFARPHLFPNVPAVVVFEVEANKHAPSYLLNHKALRDTLITLISDMTDDQKVDLLIAQRAKIVSQDEHIKVQKKSIDSTSHSVASKNRQLSNLGRQLLWATKEVHKEQQKKATEASATATDPATPQASKKRPAPVDEQSEDENQQEQRPARRVKLTHTPETTRQALKSPQSASKKSPAAATSSPTTAAQHEDREITPERVAYNQMIAEGKPRLSTIIETGSDEEEPDEETKKAMRAETMRQLEDRKQRWMPNVYKEFVSHVVLHTKQRQSR